MVHTEVTSPRFCGPLHLWGQPWVHGALQAGPAGAKGCEMPLLGPDRASGNQTSQGAAKEHLGVRWGTHIQAIVSHDPGL